MNKSKILAACMGLLLVGSSAAMADERDNYDFHEHGGRSRYEAQQQYDAQRHAQEMQQRHRWARGEHLSREYIDKRYIVTDWKLRHMRQPPRGYHWYRADDQYVLVRSSDNIITDILDALH